MHNTSYRPQITNTLIQRRRKHIANIAEHTFVIFNAQAFPQKAYNCFKTLVGGELEYTLVQVRG